MVHRINTNSGLTTSNISISVKGSWAFKSVIDKISNTDVENIEYCLHIFNLWKRVNHVANI